MLWDSQMFYIPSQLNSLQEWETMNEQMIPWEITAVLPNLSS